MLPIGMSTPFRDVAWGAVGQIENKLGTNYRTTLVKQVDQPIRMSLRSKDGLVFFPAHNRKIVSSDLTPAAILVLMMKSRMFHPAFLF